MKILSTNPVEAQNRKLNSRDATQISHPLFVNDALVYLKAMLYECFILKTILENFGNASGQMINYSKSAHSYFQEFHMER